MKKAQAGEQTGLDTEVQEVRLVEYRGQTALVEWAGKRAYVPAVDLVDGCVPVESLEMGIAYGLPWEEVITLGEVTPQRLAAALREAGIWTFEDLINKQPAAMGALQSVYGLTLSALIRAASLHKEA